MENLNCMAQWLFTLLYIQVTMKIESVPSIWKGTSCCPFLDRTLPHPPQDNHYFNTQHHTLVLPILELHKSEVVSLVHYLMASFAHYLIACKIFFLSLLFCSFVIILSIPFLFSISLSLCRFFSNFLRAIFQFTDFSLVFSNLQFSLFLSFKFIYIYI